MLASQVTSAAADENQMRVQNDSGDHKRVQNALRDFCAANDVSHDASLRLCLLLEEMFINVATYAYPEGTCGWVDVTFGCREQHVIITIEDEGAPFDPVARQLPDLTVGVDEREIGGLGIVLIRELADKVDYRYANGRNRLQVAYKLT